MAEYIKQKIQGGKKSICDSCTHRNVCKAIDNQPCTECNYYQCTADVEPVRHERWIEPSRLYYGAKQYECSFCYSDTFWNKHSITEKYPCCPNCGARMDEEAQQ